MLISAFNYVIVEVVAEIGNISPVYLDTLQGLTLQEMSTLLYKQLSSLPVMLTTKTLLSIILQLLGILELGHCT